MATWYAVGLVREPHDFAPFQGLVDLGNGVTLGSIPIWLAGAEMETREQANLTWPYVSAVTGYPTLVLFRHYEANGPDDPDPTWNDPIDRMTVGRVANDRLMLVNLAAWVVNPRTTLRFQDVVHVEQRADQTSRIRLFLHPAPLRPEFDRPGAPTLKAEHLAEIRVLSQIIGTLTREGPLWTALRSLWGALTEGWAHNRYMLLWIALEALFGPRGRGDITRRVTRNLALLLACNAQAQPALQAAATQDYDRRSGIAHGEIGRLQPGERIALILRAEDWLCRALVSILSDRHLRDIFSDQARRHDFFRDRANRAGLATPDD